MVIKLNNKTTTALIFDKEAVIVNFETRKIGLYHEVNESHKESTQKLVHIPKFTKRHGFRSKRWTADEDRQLMELVDKGLDYYKISKKFKSRTTSAIKSRLYYFKQKAMRYKAV